MSELERIAALETNYTHIKESLHRIETSIVDQNKLYVRKDYFHFMGSVVTVLLVLLGIALPYFTK